MILFFFIALQSLKKGNESIKSCLPTWRPRVIQTINMYSIVLREPFSSLFLWRGTTDWWWW